MPHNPGPDLKLAKRRAHVAEMYLQGRYQWEIAEAVGIDQGNVSRDLTAIREQWKKSAVRNFDEAKEKELARIDALEREYWQSWLDSKDDHETTSTRKVEGAGARLEESVRKEAREGNPAFLAGVQWCINKRCEILGFDAPKKNELTGKGGSPLYPSLEELVAVIVREEERGGARGESNDAGRTAGD